VQQGLTVLRIIWGALLLGQFVYLVVMFAVGKNMSGLDARTEQIFLYGAIGMLVAIVPTAYIVRGMIFNRGRDDDGMVIQQAYATGTIVFLAMCEGVGMAAITFGLLNRGRGPVLLIAAVALAVQVINFPTGRGVREE
jgi:hypothetical protein